MPGSHHNPAAGMTQSEQPFHASMSSGAPYLYQPHPSMRRSGLQTPEPSTFPSMQYPTNPGIKRTYSMPQPGEPYASVQHYNAREPLDMEEVADAVELVKSRKAVEQIRQSQKPILHRANTVGSRPYTVEEDEWAHSYQDTWQNGPRGPRGPRGPFSNRQMWG